MFPNMILTMLFAAGVIILGRVMDNRLIAIIFIVFESALASLCYARVMALAKKNK